MKNLAVLLTALLIAPATAHAADEFGSRFGNSSPYALGNTLDKAQQDTEGFGLDDLLDIEPAAGGVEPDAEEKISEEEAADPVANPAVVPGVGVDVEHGEEPATPTDPVAVEPENVPAVEEDL